LELNRVVAIAKIVAAHAVIAHAVLPVDQAVG
jgi:hypothetical protein